MKPPLQLPHPTCKACGATLTGRYCAACGQAGTVKRLTVDGILHEVFHFFTHLDKGLPYTLKKLVAAPGAMQRHYVEGERHRHQKPFSMFFLSASFTALALYWINKVMVQRYGASDAGEVAFFQHYWVLLQAALLPLYAGITYFLFRRQGYNYAEVAVLQLYTFSAVFLGLVLVHLLKFAAPEMETRYIELPLVLLYSVMTNVRFFSKGRRWLVALLSLVAVVLCYALAAGVQDALVAAFL